MPRKPRIEEIGFYHIINRGVERRTVFLEDEDCEKFFEILEDSSEVYRFSIHSFCLMPNHYHLLLETFKKNLSLIMRQINSRYSIYFNNKYKRVGPLWQGRFKSHFVYDTNYLTSLIKYIEYNPIKANMSQKIKEFKWSMSSKNIELNCLNFAFIDEIDFTDSLNDKELSDIDSLFEAKFEIKDSKIEKRKAQSLSSHFATDDREVAIASAIFDGYFQAEVARYLGLSVVSISKIYKKYKLKRKLFQKLKDKGIFWSYSKEMSYSENILIEYLLKYGDFDDIVLGFELFGKRVMKNIWRKNMMSDKQFIKTNFMLARVFFGMEVESEYFKGLKNERFEKLKLLAS